MKFILIIDSLGSGGAERQCVVLATKLGQKGHQVLILGYEKGDHYLGEVNEQGIEYCLIEEKNPIRRILKFRRKIKQIRPNAIFAFLGTSSILAELSSVPFKPWVLITSERNNLPPSFSFRTIFTLQLYRISDCVTTNAESTTKALILHAPYLTNKIKTIYNGLDLNRFIPIDSYSPNKRKVLVVVANHRKHKNAKNLILALKMLKDDNFNFLPIIYWFGSNMNYSSGKPSNAYITAVKLINEHNLENDFILKKPVLDIENIYKTADALVLCSYWEGMPNVVCEAMACGLPILMSNVSDYKVLTEENGTTLNPHSVDSIANSIKWFCNLSNEQIMVMRSVSRMKAERLFSQDKMVDSYLNLIVTN